MKKKRVAIALSGGVDSAVAALLLKEQGYELIGLHLLLINSNTIDSVRNINSNKKEIQQFCIGLGIPLHIIDLRSEFKNNVIDYFCAQYASGYTPNPCVECNKHIKFGVLLQKALSLGANHLATGHYAMINYSNGSYHLLKGNDELKDQSYVLYQLNQGQLSQVLFPIGKYRKGEIIDIAQNAKLKAAYRKSSQDICFIEGKYTDLLIEYIVPKEGDIIDKYGRILGKHRGIFFYTVGQRCRLGITSNSRLYVIGIDGNNNHIIVGTEKEVYQSELLAKDVKWISDKPPHHMEGIQARIRYKSEAVQVKLKAEGEYFRIEFYHPQRSITPGQSVVFYKDNEVLGGGMIENCKA